MIHDPFLAGLLAILGALLGTTSVALWGTRGHVRWARAELRMLRAVRSAPQLPIRHARAR